MEIQCGAMFDLWRLRRRRRKVIRYYDNIRRKLQKDPKTKAADLEELDTTASGELDDQEDSINAFLSDEIWEDARKYDIEIPRGHEHWQESLFGNRSYLNMATRAQLRRLIDEEKARRFEAKTLWVTKFWVPLLAALVGIIGALTGLVAVLHHR